MVNFVFEGLVRFTCDIHTLFIWSPTVALWLTLTITLTLTFAAAISDPVIALQSIRYIVLDA